MFAQHRNIVAAVEAYSQKRQLIKDLITRHVEVADGVVTSAVTQDEAAKAGIAAAWRALG